MNLQSEIQKRIDLATDPAFIAKCAQAAERIGMDPEYWEKNKARILLMWANEALSVMSY